MSVEDPTTYGEFYGNMMYESHRVQQTQAEKELTALAATIMDDIDFGDVLPPQLRRLMGSIKRPEGAFLGDVGGRFVSEVADGAVSQGCSPFWDAIKYAAYTKFPTKKITPPIAATLFSRNKITKELLNERFLMDGFEEIETRFQYDAMRPYPSIPDIMLWARYHGDPDYTQNKVWEKFDVDAVDYDLWEWLTYQRLTTDQVLNLYKRGKWDNYAARDALARIGWQQPFREDVMELAFQLPNAMLLVQGDLFQQKDRDRIIEDISKADIHPDYAANYLDAIMTKPPTEDIIAYQLRQDSRLPELNRELSKIGIHPNYHELYKELAHPIPAIADLITMAVREAFTPSIAQRFGQYEDFPPDFEKFAAMKGLTSEWAKRYWAAHWSLPSPQQGFEMLHRGVIERSDLELLLRAQDIMPFWRDKLIKIAFRPINRIDVRRMYRVGVLSEKDVYEAYLKLGYDEENSERMKDFVILQTRQTLSKFTTTDIVSAYKNRLIPDTEAKRLLTDLGIKREEIDYIIETAGYKRDWDFKVDKISSIGNLYRKNVYDEGVTRTELNKLLLPANEIDVLLDKWVTKKKEDAEATWTSAQTLSFLKKALISEARARQELSLLGFNTERMAIMIKSVLPS